MTIQELHQRQQWPLHQKIDHALGTVEAFVARTGKVPYVSFSGGKDSTVLLDLVRRFLYPDIKAVFCNTGNEYPEIVKFVRRTGCMFCGFGAHLENRSRFARLRELHPKAYEIFMEYTNNGITYRQALERVGVQLPDGVRQLDLFEEQ